MTAIEEAKNLAELPLDELIGNLKVYEMILENDKASTKDKKEKVKSLALKAKVTKSQAIVDSDSEEGSDEEGNEDDEEYNLMAKNFRKFFRRGGNFRRGNRFGNRGNDSRNNFGGNRGVDNKVGENSRRSQACYNCGEKGHFMNEYPKPKVNKAFVGGAWSDSEDEEQPTQDATCLMAHDNFEVPHNSSISNKHLNNNKLQKENEELAKFNDDFRKTYERVLKEKRILEQERIKTNEKIYELEKEVKILRHQKEVVEPCKSCEELTLKVDSLNGVVSNLQKESLSFSKFKKSTNDLEEIIGQQKRSQDKEGLGFSKIGKTTSESLSKTITFVKAKESENPKVSVTDALLDASTRQQRARTLREIGSSSNNVFKPITPQAPFANTRGNQAPIARRQNPKQFYNPSSRNVLGYTQPRVNHRPILPTPNVRPLSYNQRSSFQYNQSFPRRNFYNYNQRSSQYQPNNYQRRDNFYPNQSFFRPIYQTQSDYQNNPWSAFSKIGIEKLCILLQDPRMFNLGTLNANQNGPKKQWVPKT